MITQELTLINRRGLHARASAKFVKACEIGDVTITVTKGEATVNGKSIMGLMMLGAALGDTITVTADGPDASSVMQTIQALIAVKFGETE